MEKSSLMQNERDNIQNEFYSILSFLHELSGVSYAYLNISEKVDNSKSNYYTIGFDNTISDDLISLLDTIILQNKTNIITDDKVPEIKLEYLNSSSLRSIYFAGFPIINNQKKVIGSLCLMDLEQKKLSPLQIKIISQSILNIQFLINLKIENNTLLNAFKEKETQIESFYENSIEIIYELDKNGIITNFSKNWQTILGHDTNTILGANFNNFIHPEDKKICMLAVKNLTEQKSLREVVTYRIRHKNGIYVWHTSNLKIIKRKKDYYFIGNCRDITDHVESKEKLKEQKDFYIKILDRLPTDVSVMDKNHKYIYLNPVAIKNKELREFIIGKDDYEYAIHTKRDFDFANKRRKKFLEALNSRELVEWEDKIISPNGSLVTNKRKFNPVFNDDGSLEMMVGSAINITESLQIEKKIFESKKLIQRILENVAVGILVQGPNSEIIENNKAACEMLGLCQDQLLGKTSFDDQWKVIHPNGSNYKPEEHPVPKAIRELKPVKGIVMGVFRPMNNDLIWLLVDAIPVFDDNKSLLYVICSFNNITNQINAENALKISNERFFYSNKASSDVIWDWNLITNKVFYGDGYFEHFGFDLNNTLNNLGENSNLVHPSDKEKAYNSMKEAISGTNDFWEHEYRHIKSDNTFAIVKDTAYIVRDDKGKALRIIGAMKDITEERKLKDKLQQSEEQFKGAFNHSAAGMALIDAEGFFIETNERLIEITGYSSIEMKSITIHNVIYEKDLKQLLTLMNKLVSKEISKFNTEIRFNHKNKISIWTHISVSLIENSTEKHYICQIIDISDRKRIEEENKLLLEENNKNKEIQLDEAKNLYRLLANNTVDLVCLHDLDSTFEYVSPSVKKLVGYNPNDLIGKAPRDFVHPVDLERFQNSIKTKSFLENKISENGNYRFKNANGNYIWLQITTILLEKDGIPVGFQTNGREITKELEAQQNIEKSLKKERKLNELRTNLVSTISHEFRTPMTTIRTSAELISMYIEGQNIENSNLLQKRVNIITQEIDRIVELMNAILTISKDDSGKTDFDPAIFNLKTLCIETIDKNFTELKNKRKINLNYSGTNFQVYADKNLMEYSISNILNNAVKYSENSDQDVELNIISNDSKCEIQVIDYGIGIPKKDQDKLFNTFYRASNTDGIPGTGLGLYIVKNFVEKNKGAISLQSKLEKGTKVIMQFSLQKI